MRKFITRFGSYTLVLKPNGSQPVYDHKGRAVRVEGVIYCEFQPVKGTSVGVFETDDESVIELLRKHQAFNISFKEILSDEDIPKTDSKLPIKLGKGPLMACNKTELLDIAKQYSIITDETDSKVELVNKILEAQEKGISQPEAEILPAQQSGIKRIVQNNSTNAG
jgi:hypothetical protein